MTLNTKRAILILTLFLVYLLARIIDPPIMFYIQLLMQGVGVAFSGWIIVLFALPDDPPNDPNRPYKTDEW